MCKQLKLSKNQLDTLDDREVDYLFIDVDQLSDGLEEIDIVFDDDSEYHKAIKLLGICY